jgi:serine/threonine protein phosphatase PrpC
MSPGIDELRNPANCIPNVIISTIKGPQDGRQLRVPEELSQSQATTPQPNLNFLNQEETALRSSLLSAAFANTPAVEPCAMERSSQARNYNSTMSPSEPGLADQDKEFVCHVGAHTVAGKHLNCPGWINQDVHLVMPLSNKMILAAVFDGHGPKGQLVAEFIKKVFVRYAEDLLVTQELAAEEALVCLFRVAHEGLTGVHDLAQFSGSTAAAAIVDGRSGIVTTAHAGDTRILVLEDSAVVFETRDHSISAEDIARIIASGGEVREVSQSGIKADRIFVRGTDYPGLAMSRSLGDLEAQRVGAPCCRFC